MPTAHVLSVVTGCDGLKGHDSGNMASQERKGVLIGNRLGHFHAVRVSSHAARRDQESCGEVEGTDNVTSVP